RQGRLAAVRHVRLTTLEGQPASLNSAEDRAMVMNRNVTATGVVTNSITRRNVGTKVEVLPRVGPDGQVNLDLHVEESRVVAAPAGAPSESVALMSLKTAVSVPAGRAVLASGSEDDAKSGRPQTVVVVTARVAEPEATGAR